MEELTAFKISDLVSEEQSYRMFRAIRWREGVKCPHCGSSQYHRWGHHASSEHRNRYHCKDCKRYYDDLTKTVFEGRHKPLSIWLLCLYLMSLGLSITQIAKELGLGVSDAHHICSTLRNGIVEQQEPKVLEGEVEIDEMYLVSGHKGQTKEISKKKRKPRKRRLKGKRGRGTMADEKPPILGMVQRGGDVQLRVLSNVKSATIRPMIEQWVSPKSTIYTDEYNIYNWLSDSCKYKHQVVRHGRGEFALDKDGDGIYEVHVNTMECVWSILRPFLAIHRGIAQNNLEKYVTFFQILYNLRRRGWLAMHGILALLIST